MFLHAVPNKVTKCLSDEKCFKQHLQRRMEHTHYAVYSVHCFLHLSVFEINKVYSIHLLTYCSYTQLLTTWIIQGTYINIYLIKI